MARCYVFAINEINNPKDIITATKVNAKTNNGRCEEGCGKSRMRIKQS